MRFALNGHGFDRGRSRPKTLVIPRRSRGIRGCTSQPLAHLALKEHGFGPALTSTNKPGPLGPEACLSQARPTPPPAPPDGFRPLPTRVMIVHRIVAFPVRGSRWSGLPTKFAR